MVHRQQLLDQWVEKLQAFLDVAPDTIGMLCGDKKRLTGKIDVALIQSLVSKHEVDDRVTKYGHVIVDECHHVSATSFEEVTKRHPAIVQATRMESSGSACKRCGIEGITLHSLRHTFASRVVQAGLSLMEIQNLLGHASPITSLRYAHLAPNQAASKAVAALDRFNGT